MFIGFRARSCVWLALVFGAFACGSSSTSSGADTTSSGTPTGPRTCTASTDCAIVQCICLGGNGTTIEADAQRCTNGTCAAASESCPLACEAGVFGGGSWTGQTKSSGATEPAGSADPAGTTPCSPPSLKRPATQCAGTYVIDGAPKQCATFLSSAGIVCSHACTGDGDCGTAATCSNGFCLPK